MKKARSDLPTGNRGAMTCSQIMDELKSLGTAQTKKVLIRHGAREPFFGVKIADLQKIRKHIKTNHALAMELWDTGISDAMYLAGMIVDDSRMTKKDLQRWVEKAYWSMLGEYTVAPTAAGSAHGWEMALKWIDSKKVNIAATGWSTLSCIVSWKDDSQLDLTQLKSLLKRASETIHDQPDRARYAMNSFVIAAGCYVKPLTQAALQVAKQIGKVSVDMGETECKVPAAAEYIEKVAKRGTIGQKRKGVKC